MNRRRCHKILQYDKVRIGSTSGRCPAGEEGRLWVEAPRSAARAGRSGIVKGGGNRASAPTTVIPTPANSCPCRVEANPAVVRPPRGGHWWTSSPNPSDEAGLQLANGGYEIGDRQLV